MSQSNRAILVKLLIGFVLAYLLLLTFYWQESRGYAVREAEKLQQNVLFSHRAVHRYVTTVQRPEIYRLQNEGLLYKEYFQPQAMSFTFIGRSVQEMVNEERVKAGAREVYFKLASDNPRNPINRADEWESRLLARFNKEDLEEFKEVFRAADGKEYLYFAMPVDVSKTGCLKCHGDPKDAPRELIERYGDKAGFWEKTNVIRALISIRVPLEDYLGNAKLIFAVLSSVTFGVFAAMYLAIFLFIRRIDRQEGMLIQSEKMASLGRLVAGFAHEINTPIGVAVGSSTHAMEVARQARRMLDQEEVDERELIARLDDIEDACRLTYANLDRTAGLVSSFKRTSVDQTRDEARLYNLGETVRDVVTSLHEVLKRSPVKVRLECASDVELYGHPGALGQIITNLINNSLTHAFDPGQSGEIVISAKRDGMEVVVEFSDNGKGMDAHTRAHIFEPFFTTTRGKGGTGLGLFICHNLATSELKGSLSVDSEPGKGTRFALSYPVEKAPQVAP